MNYFVDFFAGLLDQSLVKSLLVGVFKHLYLFEDVNGSFGHMFPQIQIFISQELKNLSI